ncbi:MAG: acylphosphatase [Gammaproteobacteria bacterium]|nr:acylphosphatase [Gammaproteobacteria bacterium]
MKTVKFTVSGRVQGVGFRYATREAADNLGIAGWVRNRRDGDVEGVAQASEPRVEQFVRWLGRGPRQAGVHRVTVEPVDAQRFTRFDIRT